MGYVDSQLLPNEEVRYTAHLHKMIFAGAVIFALLAAVGAYFAARGTISWIVPAIPAIIALGYFVWAYVHYTSSEFAVTNKRVIIKVGFVQRRTLETILSKVEAIGVEQGIIGRMMGFGTLSLTGTGGTREEFERIASPLEFRKQVHAAIVDAVGNYPVSHVTETRDERECPYCAERVLVRARVCKHCGRDLPAATV